MDRIIIEFERGDCLDGARKVADEAVDFVLTDLPYGTIKGMGRNTQYADGLRSDWDTIVDTSAIMANTQRVLRYNGKAAFFGNQPFTTELINHQRAGLPFIYVNYWHKLNFANALIARIAPVSVVEDIAVFKKPYPNHDYDLAHPLRPYFAEVLKYIGKPKREIFAKLGTRLDHTLRVNSSQFSLCTREAYADLVAEYQLRQMHTFKSFDELEPINRAHVEELLARVASERPSVFNLPKGQGHKKNIFTYKKDRDNIHSTQKPVALLVDLILTYTREGDTVLDWTAGSASCAIAAASTGRHFKGWEMDATHYADAVERLRIWIQAQPNPERYELRLSVGGTSGAAPEPRATPEALALCLSFECKINLQ